MSQLLKNGLGQGKWSITKERDKPFTVDDTWYRSIPQFSTVNGLTRMRSDAAAYVRPSANC